MTSHSPMRTCSRCGRRRQVIPGRGTGLCSDCTYVEPEWPDVQAVEMRKQK